MSEQGAWLQQDVDRLVILVPAAVGEDALNGPLSRGAEAALTGLEAEIDVIAVY